MAETSVQGESNRSFGSASSRLQVALVGPPNVGKSALFNRLTNSYVTVSNYPGTTVGISRGELRSNRKIQLEDTPGLYSLLPLTDEELVAREYLFADRADVLVHVVDVKSLRRHLPLAFELIALGLDPILFINFMDEARKIGIQVDAEKLSEALGITVICGSAAEHGGLDQLEEEFRRRDDRRERRALASGSGFDSITPGFHVAFERIANQLEGEYPGGRHACSWLVLLGDTSTNALIRRRESSRVIDFVERTVEEANRDIGKSPQFALQEELRAKTLAALARSVRDPRFDGSASSSGSRGAAASRVRRFAENLCESPLTGLPIAILVLYFGFYKIVGVLGAGKLVDFLEGTVFGEWILPRVEPLFRAIPWETVQNLFIGEYGILTMGITYALALVMPIVTLFFLVFSLLEDTGYLPRFAMLVDRITKKIGLSGRALIPITLGFGCDTMAVVVTRIQETRRERYLTTLLLALAIPCSAQLGLLLGALSPRPAVLWLWMAIVGATFLSIGFLAHRILPGRAPTFHMELPPMRFPQPGNVLSKTYSRVYWYFREVIPLFVFASFLIWLGKLIVVGGKDIFAWCVTAITPLVSLLGLPDTGKTAETMFFGFFRRDYAAAHLISGEGVSLLEARQLLVIAVVLTLFIPCIAQLMMMIKEQGLKIALFTAGAVFVIAFVVGISLNAFLVWTRMLG